MATGELFYQSFPIILNDGEIDTSRQFPGLDDIFPPDNFEIIGRHIINPTGSGGANRAVVIVVARELADVPTLPLSVNANPGASGEIVLTWNVPASDGGAPITDYFIEFSVQSINIFSIFVHAPDPTTGITIDGLVSAVIYDIRVSAVNASGTGADANASSVSG